MADRKQLMINTSWCKGCGICAAFCPAEALELKDGKVAVKEGAACSLCGQCELRCPDYAIYIIEPEGATDQWVKPY